MEKRALYTVGCKLKHTNFSGVNQHGAHLCMYVNSMDGTTKPHDFTIKSRYTNTLVFHITRDTCLQKIVKYFCWYAHQFLNLLLGHWVTTLCVTLYLQIPLSTHNTITAELHDQHVMQSAFHPWHGQ